MPRKRKVDNSNEQLERLNSQVRLDGVGEDPAVKAMLSPEFAEMPNSQALDIALALQDLIRGQNSILSNQKEQAEELGKLRERMDKYDKAEEAWKKDRAGFIEKVRSRAEDLRIEDPKEKARLQARVAKELQAEIQRQVAEQTLQESKLKQMLETMPKVIVTSPGKLESVNEGGVIHQRLVPEVIKLRNFSFVLQPGVPTEVPQLIAEEFYSRQRVQQENMERKALLNASKPKNNVEVADKWNAISKKYKSTEEIFRGEER